MKSKKFYINEGKSFYADNKKLKYICVSDPEIIHDFTKITPEENERFVEVKRAEGSKSVNSVEEKLYRVLCDINTVGFFNEETFDGISQKVSRYLSDIEDWERMCVLRDIGLYYKKSRSKKSTEIESFIKSHEKQSK